MLRPPSQYFSVDTGFGSYTFPLGRPGAGSYGTEGGGTSVSYRPGEGATGYGVDTGFGGYGFAPGRPGEGSHSVPTGFGSSYSYRPGTRRGSSFTHNTGGMGARSYGDSGGPEVVDIPSVQDVPGGYAPRRAPMSRPTPNVRYYGNERGMTETDRMQYGDTSGPYFHQDAHPAKARIITHQGDKTFIQEPYGTPASEMIPMVANQPGLQPREAPRRHAFDIGDSLQRMHGEIPLPGDAFGPPNFVQGRLPGMGGPMLPSHDSQYDRVPRSFSIGTAESNAAEIERPTWVMDGKPQYGMVPMSLTPWDDVAGLYSDETVALPGYGAKGRPATFDAESGKQMFWDTLGSNIHNPYWYADYGAGPSPQFPQLAPAMAMPVSYNPNEHYQPPAAPSLPMEQPSLFTPPLPFRKPTEAGKTNLPPREPGAKRSWQQENVRKGGGSAASGRDKALQFAQPNLPEMQKAYFMKALSKMFGAY